MTNQSLPVSGLMINYMKIAWRSLFKNSVTNSISIAGLVVGLCGAFLMGLFVLDELEYDQHFRNKTRVYRVTSTYHHDGHAYQSAQTKGNVAQILTAQVSGIEAATRLLPADEAFLFTETAAFKEQIIYTDGSFLEVFGLDLMVGDRSTCLSHPSSVIISEHTAIKLFGANWKEQELLSRTVSIDGWIPLSITGVFKDFPQQTHFRSNLFASIPSGFESWADDHSELYTYVLLHPNVPAQAINGNSDTPGILAAVGHGGAQLNLQPLANIYLYSSLGDENAAQGNVKNIYALILISLFLVAITVINFANLYTAGCLNRLKEVGVRKVVGAIQGQLRMQFYGETLLITLLSLALAIGLAIGLLPAFNDLTGKQFLTSSLFTVKAWMLIGGLTIITVVMAGSYPSLFLSSRKTIEALKGLKDKAVGPIEFRKGLIVIQFFLSCVMIIVSIVAFRQIKLITTRDPGFDKKNTIAIANPYMLGTTENVLAFKSVLGNVRGIEGISITGYTPSQERWKRERITFPGRNALSSYRQHANWITVDENFIATMGIRLIEGRNFSDNHEHDSTAVIINETAAAQFNLNRNRAGPLGADLSCQDDLAAEPEHFHVVGVVADFNFGSLHEPVKPVIMKLGYHRFELAIRLSPQYSVQETITRIETVWKKYLPLIPFEYGFIENRYNALHQSDITASRLFSIFCLLTIFVSAMGLFSMVTYAVVNRTKEFGIRKLLGASSLNIGVLVMGDFLKPVVLSYLIALPFAWAAATRWIESFAYRTEVRWWIFAVAGLILFVVCVLTLAYQSMKAARANPVDNLRHE